MPSSVSTTAGQPPTFHAAVDPPLKEFNFRMSRFGVGISNFRSCFEAFGELFKRQMGEQFETEGRAGGSRWKPLSPAYRDWKRAHGLPTRIGVRYGNLLAAMTGGAGYSEHVTKTEASWGMSDSSKAAPYGREFDKARKVIALGAKQGRQYQKIAHQWFVAEERGAFGSSSTLKNVVKQGGGYSKDFLGVDLTSALSSFTGKR